MKKNKFLFAFLALVLLFSQVVFADVQVSEDGTNEGRIRKLNLSTGLNMSRSGGTGTITTELLNNGRGAAATLTLASSTTPITDSSLPYSVIVKSVGGGGGNDSAGSGTILPDAPVNGQSISIIIAGLQSGGSWIVTPTTKTGFNSITFDTKGDTATLLFVNATIGWIITSNGGAVINQS